MSGITSGFDIDGIVSPPDDVRGCGKPDYRSPPPDNIPGVDNQLGSLVASLEASLGFDTEMAIRDSLAKGTLLILLAMENVDDVTNDDCVTLNLLSGAQLNTMCTAGGTECLAGWICGAMNTCVPMVTGDGSLGAGQTFDVDTSSFMDGTTTPRISITGELVGGRFRSFRTGQFSLDIPLMGGRLLIDLLNPQVRLSITGGAVSTGVIGGGANNMQLGVAVANAINMPGLDVAQILRGQADLEPDGSGSCNRISLGLEFVGVGATRGANVTEP